MKKYFQKLQERHPHEKRRVSMQAAMVLTALIFIGWLTTLGPSLSNSVSGGGAVAGSDTSNLVAATAAAGSDLSNDFGQIQSTMGTINSSNTANGTAASQSTPTATTSEPATVLDGVPIDQSTNTQQTSETTY